MAKKPHGDLTTLPELAKWVQSIWSPASPTYLSSVIQRLARGGVVRSHRGIGGGYSLARPASEISLRDLFELLEGVDLDRCSLSLEGACPVGGHCSIQRRLRRLENEFLLRMETVTIADLAKEVVRRVKA
jgi:Rrf2 family protein